MLKRARRLPLGARALERGETASSPYFLVKFQKNTLDHHRFGVIVSVRAGKTAVVRHIIKRELLARALEWLEVDKKGYDFLFIASPRLGGIEKNAVRGLLRSEFALVAPKIMSRLSR